MEHAGKNKEMLSIVVPCYNEESCIEIFLRELDKVELNIGVEIVFVDDGSDDNTLAVIKQSASRDERIKYISFSRNFGKESALLAGLRKAKGDFIVTMDVDLQDPPSLLPVMLDAVRTGEYDCAATRRVNRNGEPPIRSFFAKLFYKLMRRYSDVALVDGARDYRLMRKKVVDAIVAMPEVNRFTKGIYQWVGFRTKWIEFDNIKRSAGVTKWSFRKLLYYAVDGVLAFSTAPLQIASVLGCIGCLISLLALLFVVVRRLIFGDPVAGWASLVCIIVFFFSIMLLFMGIFGLYLAKMYRETKCRPMYFIREEI